MQKGNDLQLLIYFFITIVFFQSIAKAKDFSSEDLHKAARIALDTFKKDNPELFYKNIYGYQISLKKEGAKAKVFFKKGADNAELEYFCHYHEAEKNVLDCHEI